MWAVGAPAQQHSDMPGIGLGVQVMFTPASGHSSHYKQSLTIKVTHNSKSPAIACTGSGFTLKPAFEPPMLDLGAALPAFDGQKPKEAVLRLTNPFDTDMEVRLLPGWHACIC